MFNASIWGVLALPVLASCLSSLALVRSHRRHLTHPLLQRKIIGIAWMVPIYAIQSWLSLAFVEASLVLDMVRDCYEAYVVYLFFALCVAYMGEDGENDVVDTSRVIRVLQEKRSVAHAWPVRLWSKPWDLESDANEFLLKCKTQILQFVVVKPLTTFIAICCELGGCYEEGSFDLSKGYIYVSFMQNSSISLSLYYLGMFYVATRAAYDASFRPKRKFLCIKSVLFATFWQSVVIAILVQAGWIRGVDEFTTQNVAVWIQDCLVCVEMFVASILHHFAFPVTPFLPREPMLPDARETSILHRLGGELLSRTASQDEDGSFRDALPWGGTGLRDDFNEVSPIVISGGHFKSHVVAQANKIHVPSPFPEDAEEKTPDDTGNETR